jgi:hypothetical protein
LHVVKEGRQVSMRACMHAFWAGLTMLPRSRPCLPPFFQARKGTKVRTGGKSALIMFLLIGKLEVTGKGCHENDF